MKKKFRVGSLFAGVGGICFGFMQAFDEKAEYEMAWANEMDEYACETYRTNFKHLLFEGDIRKILCPEKVHIEIEDLKKIIEDLNNKVMMETNTNEKVKLEKEILVRKKMLLGLELNRDRNFEYYSLKHKEILGEKIHVLNGGFPCQAFSIAGEQKGFEDDRGNLFLNIIELINQLGEVQGKPRILFLENVKNLKSHDGGRTYQVIKGELEKEGYIIKEAVLNTMDFSDLPQNRERIYIIGFLESDDAEKFDMFSKLHLYRKQKKPEDRAEDVKKIIDYTVDDKKYYYTKEKYPHYFVTKEEYEKNVHSKKDVRINLEEDITEMYQFYQLRRGMYVRKNMSNVCPTLTANMGTGGHNVPLIKVNDGIRKLTPEETFKLQGFPVGQGYTLPIRYKNKAYGNANLYKQAGNAVSVPVIKLLAEELLRILASNLVDGNEIK